MDTIVLSKYMLIECIKEILCFDGSNTCNKSDWPRRKRVKWVKICQNFIWVNILISGRNTFDIKLQYICIAVKEGF